MLKRFFALVVFALMPLVGQADDAQDLLRAFVRDVQSAQGQFSQVRVDDQGHAAGTPQKGTFSFQRPGKFKWAVDQPYEQLTLSDGKQLYQVDPDLAQVIVRSVDESVGASPAAILFGSGDLGDAFVLSGQPQADGLVWLRAKPRDPDAGFSHVDIGFNDAAPRRLLLRDSFGQTTRIDLEDMVTNPELPAQEFSFQAPDGFDVIQM